MKPFRSLLLVLGTLGYMPLFAQRITAAGADLNAIKTAATFLTISPDARAGGLGDAGVASRPDAYSMHWNVAKYAFTGDRFGMSASYTPWLRELIPDISLTYSSAYFRIGQRHTISSSMRFFSLGEIIFTNSTGIVQHIGHPYELATDLGYSYKFGRHLSAGASLRYIFSELTSGYSQTDMSESQPGRSLAGDLGLYYQNEIPVEWPRMEWAMGILLSNLGSPISYSKEVDGTPIPSNFRIGGRYDVVFSQDHRLGVLADLNKLLVPTPPVYHPDSVDSDGNPVVIRGKEPPETIVAGMFSSFWDAPGFLTSDGTYSVLREELSEISMSLGFEYELMQMMSFRTGCFLEHVTKGNRKYLTMGYGIKFWKMMLDLSCLIPLQANSPLANTFRFSLSAGF